MWAYIDTCFTKNGDYHRDYARCQCKSALLPNLTIGFTILDDCGTKELAILL